MRIHFAKHAWRGSILSIPVFPWDVGQERAKRRRERGLSPTTVPTPIHSGPCSCPTVPHHQWETSVKLFQFYGWINNFSWTCFSPEKACSLKVCVCVYVCFEAAADQRQQSEHQQQQLVLLLVNRDAIPFFPLFVRFHPTHKQARRGRSLFPMMNPFCPRFGTGGWLPTLPHTFRKLGGRVCFLGASQLR